MRYPIYLRWSEEDQAWIAEIPDLPGCMADGKTETKEAGTAHFEPRGWLHQWANSADAPLVLLQANMSEEGVPAVVMVQPPSSGPTR